MFILLSLHLPGPQCCWAGLWGKAFPASQGREKPKGLLPVALRLFFLLVWFLLIPFNKQLSPVMEWSQDHENWLPAGAVGRRSPAAVGKKSDGSSKKQN